jgi:hypothetical protein
MQTYPFFRLYTALLYRRHGHLLKNYAKIQKIDVIFIGGDVRERLIFDHNFSDLKYGGFLPALGMLDVNAWCI